jgi:hypothetical protein
VAVLLIQDDLPDPARVAAGTPPAPGSGWMLAGLCVAAFLLGTAEVVRDNAAQTMLPQLVPHSRLETANGRLWGVETVSNSFAGPPLAGVLLGVAASVPFGVHAGLLVIAAALVASIARRTPPATARTSAAAASSTPAAHAHDKDPASPAGPIDSTEPAEAGPTWTADITEGLRWLWAHRVLRTLALTLGVLNLLGALTSAVFVLFVQDVLGLFDGWQFGLLLTGMAAGGVIGSLVGDRVAERLRRGTALLVSVAGMTLATIVIALSSHALLVAAAGALEGFFILVWNIITVSFRQRIIPDRLLGRVNSVYRLFGWGTIAVGSLGGGAVVVLAQPLLGREWALRSVFLLAAAGMLVALVVIMRRLDNRTIDAAIAAAEES